MNSVFEKLRKKDSRVNVRRISNGAEKISIATDNVSLHTEKEVSPLDTGDGIEPITIRNSCVLAQNIDALLADSAALTFFIQFLECYGRFSDTLLFFSGCIILGSLKI
ncbi:hypothetical protein COOONC_16214 [Cooperia oncophora]